MIVVTGATGHIGNVLVRDLLSRGKDVRALIPPFEDATALAGLSVERVEGDVLDVGSLTRAFEGAEVVYHLAGIVSITSGKSDLLRQVNVIGTRNVAQACRRCGVRRLVYTSSIHAMAEPPHGTIVDEASPFDPDRTIGDYGRSKAQASLEVLAAARQGLDAVIVCPTGVIGPYDFKLSEMSQLFVEFARRRLKVYTDGAYDFVDVRDVATGHVLASEKGRAGEHYILSGERITLADLMFMLEDVTGVSRPRLKVPVWLAQAMASVAPPYYRLTDTKPLYTRDSMRIVTSNSLVSQEKARREIGYCSRPIRTTVADTVQWLKGYGKL